MAEAIKTFKGAPHRLALVAEVDGVEYVDDSKATNIDAMVKAIESFHSPIRLIAGGRDKDSPFRSATGALAGCVERAYLIGEASEKIATAWGETFDCKPCETLAKAVEAARKDARAGDIVLLSPGCASFDQFKSFADRGEQFAEMVRAL